jgi:transcription antitermination factor NusG
MTWYIAITNPNCHRRAESGLAAIGYPTFWPKLRKWTSHARVKVAKEYPILGRYLFVEIPDGEFFAVRNVNGVEALLTGDAGAPAKIPADVVWAFRERYMRGEWDFVANETGEFLDYRGEPTTRQNPIPTGAQIRIMEGEFADLLTIVRGRRNGKLQFLPPGKREFFYTREANVRAA